MANENNVHLVKSISCISFPCGRKIDGMPPTLNIQSVHMHGTISVGSIVVASNFVEVEIH
jgi:hypothetical protein